MVKDNAAKYREVSSREYLIRCFERGEKRASVSFSTRSPRRSVPQPCRQVFYLYRDNASGHILCFAVIYELTEEQRQEKEREELENALHMSRIRNFTSQMQPHFLYNALGSIQEIILEDPAYASELLGDFTIHLRSCIRTMANDDALPFDQELENIKAYVNIEKMRFGAKLRVEYEIAATNFAIIPLSIQPLVENAIRHGIYARGKQGGTVTIRTRETPASWIVQVEDDGVGFDVAAIQEEMALGLRDSTGLKNLMFRLDKVMHAVVDVRSTVGVGTTVTVTIPKGGNSK
jgi:LytS/YehU family sensor histidine kinase